MPVGRSAQAPEPGDLIVVGEVTRPHGVRGGVRVRPVTDFPDHLLALDRVVVVHNGAARAVRVERAEAVGRFVVLQLSGVTTPEAAAALAGATIEIPRADARALPAGTFYVFQVVGLPVRTPDGRALGRVVDVLRTGSNDVYVVAGPDGREVLLPATDDVIRAVDLAGGVVIASPPEWM